MLQDFKSISDRFTILRSKGLGFTNLYLNSHESSKRNSWKYFEFVQNDMTKSLFLVILWLEYSRFYNAKRKKRFFSFFWKLIYCRMIKANIFFIISKTSISKQS